MDNLNKVLGAMGHDDAEKFINGKIRKRYPDLGLRITLHEDEPCQNFYAPCAQRPNERRVKLCGRRMINLVYGILSDNELYTFKAALKLILDHEARHIAGGKEQNEFDAQMYALSMAEDPLESISKEIGMLCYVGGSSPEKALETQLNYWGHCGAKKTMAFPLNEKAKTEIMKKSEKYAALLRKKGLDGSLEVPFTLYDAVVPWSRVYG